MNRIRKIWGTTEPLVITPMFEMHRLLILPGYRCSLHVHRWKHNAFYVVAGRLCIDTVLGDVGGEVRSAWLNRGDYCTIPPGVHHQFRTGTLGDPGNVLSVSGGCVALEMYYTEPLSEDIIRRNIGGRVDG